MIRHEGSKWVLYTHDGSRVLGKHDSKEEAERQEAAIKANEHKAVVERAKKAITEHRGKS